MKEETKKTTTKKTVTRKSTTTGTTKKTTAKSSKPKTKTTKATATKTTPVKKVSTKKTTTKKSSTSKPKTSTTKKTTSVAKKVTEPKVAVTKKVEEENLNRDLILRSVLLISYTLIIVLLIMGFIDSLSKVNAPKVEKEVTSYIEKNNLFSKSNIIELEDASFKLNALNGDYFVYITYTDEKVNAFEKELIELLNEKNIKDKFYYVNIDKIKDETNVIELVNKYLNYKDALVTKVPTIVYINKDNVLRVENIINRLDNNMMDINDVQSLLDRNGF